MMTKRRKPTRRESQSLIVMNYNGGLIRAATPQEVGRDDGLATVAFYSAPKTSEVIEVDPEASTRKRGWSELPECLKVGSNLFPVHDAANFVRWIEPTDAAALEAISVQLAELQAKRDRLMTAAYKRGRPITADECRQMRK